MMDDVGGEERMYQVENFASAEDILVGEPRANRVTFELALTCVSFSFPTAAPRRTRGTGRSCRRRAWPDI